MANFLSSGEYLVFLPSFRFNKSVLIPGKLAIMFEDSKDNKFLLVNSLITYFSDPISFFKRFTFCPNTLTFLDCNFLRSFSWNNFLFNFFSLGVSTFSLTSVATLIEGSLTCSRGRFVAYYNKQK